MVTSVAALHGSHLVGATAPSGATRALIAASGPLIVDLPELAIAGAASRCITNDGRYVIVVCGNPTTAGDGVAGADRALQAAAARLLDRDLEIYDLVRHLIGLWSLVGVDRRRSRLALCTHPLGGRTIHWQQTTPSTVVFGDEVRDVLSAGDRTPEIDTESVASWATSWSFLGSRTVYRGIERLHPGSVAHVDSRRMAVQRWYRPSVPPTSSLITDVDEAVDLTQFEVDAAVARAAGPGVIGVALSGGVDSSFVVSSLAATIGRERVLALSNVFPDHDTADEAWLIDHTVAALALSSERLAPGVPDVVPTWTEFTRTWKVPLGTPMIAVTHPLRRRAVELGLGSLITGEGGDELFVNWPAPWLSDLVRTGHLARAWRTAGALPYAHPGARTRLRNLHEPLVALLPRPLARRVFTPDFVDFGLLRSDLRAAARDAEENARRIRDEAGPFWWRGRRAAIAGFRHTADVDGTIRRVARLAGIDERHPLMHDLQVNEALPRIHPSLHFDRRMERIIARRALRRRLPPEVAFQPGKRHFSGVLVDAMSGLRREWIVDTLRSSTRLGEFFDPGRVAQLTAPNAEARHAEGARGWVLDAYKLVAIELWLKELER